MPVEQANNLERSEAGPARLAVVIPTRDRWAILRQTLDALRVQTVSGFEVVIVVDGEDQAIPEWLVADRVIQQRQAGPAAARNAGVAATDRDLVLFLGDDMIPHRGCIAEHLRAHQTFPEVGDAVLGRVKWHAFVAWRPENRWLDLSGTQFDYVNIEPADGDDVGFGRFYSCNVSMKRSLFEKVGGFDPDFVFYYEDLDMGWRLEDAGMTLRYAPRAVTRHRHAYDASKIRSRFVGIALGERMMQAKHPDFDPWFKGRISQSMKSPTVSRAWRVLGQLPAPRRLQRKLVGRATRWHHQQVAGGFERAWDRAGLVTELAEYLGDEFDASQLIHHADSVQQELESIGDEEDFYRRSTSYLYDLTVFGMADTKDPYHDVIRDQVPVGGRLLDYGCGIGADGVRLLDGGYDVSFADFTSPSTTYLRWRLSSRGSGARVYDIESDEIPGSFDLAYSFDVIEHVADPWRFLAHLEERASLVLVNLLEEDDHDHEHQMHRDLPIDEILAHARRRGLVHYALHHERSHLVCYRGRSI